MVATKRPARKGDAINTDAGIFIYDTEKGTPKSGFIGVGPVLGLGKGYVGYGQVTTLGK